MDQVTPNGNLTYSQSTWADGTPKYTATQTLSAAGQQLQNTNQGTAQNLANLAQQQSGKLSGMLNQDFSLNNLPAAGAAPQYQDYTAAPQLQTSLGSNDFSGDRKRVEDAMFTRLNPQTDRDRQNLETSLVNRGIRPGSSAYQQEMGTFNQGLNDQRTSILLNAGQEQNRMQQLALNAGNFGNSATQQNYANAQAATGLNNSLQDSRFSNANTARQNAMQEQLTARNVPLNEILALSGQSQIQQPTFVNNSQTQVGGTDVAGLIGQGYQNQVNAYNQQQQQLGGLFSAGASALPLLMASDARVKRMIRRIGTLANGFGWYSFKYIWDDVAREGVMAQEVMQTRPDLIHTHPDGYMMVNYGGIL